MWLTFLLIGIIIGLSVGKLLNSGATKSRTHYLNKAFDNVNKVAKSNEAEDSPYIKGVIFGLEQAFKLTGTPRKKNERYSKQIDKLDESISHLPSVKILIDTTDGELEKISVIPEELTIDEFVERVVNNAESRGEKIISIYKENKNNNSYDIKLYET